MDTDTTSASGQHPATMPNPNAESQPQSTEVDSLSSQQLPSVSNDALAEGAVQDVSNHELPQEAVQTQPATDGTFLDQLDDDDAGAAAWDLSEPAPASTSVPATEHDQPPAPNEEPTVDESEPAPTSNAAKHSSTISFARTVSHEVNFNDDEDVEWNLQRTETDPFKFMPPNERTNSFPAVPQMENAEDRIDSPPPSSQAQEILQELERHDPHADTAAQSDFPGQFEEGHGDSRDTAGDDSAQQYVGGDIVGTEEEASDARFEEGLPLIPQDEPRDPNAEHESGPSSSGDPFAQDEAGEGDDFFSQIQSDPRPTDGTFDHTLHRKSTTMVIRDAMNTAPGAGNLDSEPPTPIEPAPKAQVIPDTTAKVEANDDSTSVPNKETDPQGKTNDIDAKWAAAFEDDDDVDFLADSAAETKELDPADIFGSDDEGFLEDTEDTPAATSTVASQPAASAYAPAQPSQTNMNGRYTPTNLPQPQITPNPYAPTPAISQMPPLQQHPSYVHPGTAPPMALGYAPPPPKPELPKAQSFVGKSKGGYQSPYDLPMDVVKPKKRQSMQQLSRPGLAPPAPPAGPPRSASMHSQPPPLPSRASTASLSPPSSSHSNQQPSFTAQKVSPQLKSQPSFFEDLPLSSKPRSASRQSHHLASPQQSPLGQPSPPLRGPPPMSSPMATPPMASPPMVSPPIQSHPTQEQAVGIPALVAPERINPYGALHSDSHGKPPPPTNRYSPAPPQLAASNGMPPPPVSTSRYSPAPPSVRSSSSGFTAVPPPILAHLPRTSSPLAHFEVSHDKHQNKLQSPVSNESISQSRSSSSQYEPRITRVPSLPPTQEVEEEQSPVRSPQAASKSSVNASSPESRYSPRQARHTHTPPPSAGNLSGTLSPPKRVVSNYAPQSAATMPVKEVSFAPPPRSQTQSPGSLYGRTTGIPIDPVPRPSSVQGSTPPREVTSPEIPRPTVRARGMSQHLNLVPPSDGRELDPLQRWRGAPVIAWGIGGSFVSSFPKDIPRYGISQALPQIIRSPGEVKVKHIRDIYALEERLAKFPGPLKGKSKKKETLVWLTAGIDGLERNLPNVSFQHVVSHEDKRAVERVLLWKILRVFIEHDGNLEGNPAVEKAVRDVISPGLNAENPELASAVSTGVDLTGIASSVTTMQADAVDSTAIEQIRTFLLSGDREKAVWAAADKRLWGHAMLISNTLQNAELYKQVAREFIKKEVNRPGHSNESLAALYGVLSGNFEESVDELVPVHARAGLQLISTSAAIGSSQDALAGLDKWRETLGLVLSNRSQGDVQALRALGNLLSGYGRAEAAHICYIFARNFAIFGGLDDPNANFVLVGADHRRQADQFAKETEALQLSEVYEYGLSLTGGSHISQSSPHLAAYKLQHAEVLAEYGFRDKALQYCEGIYGAIISQTKRSPYYNPILESSVDDLMRRLKQAPKEESSSWIPKPSMNQVSNNMWSRFNKFVAGDDDETGGNGASGEVATESGPFAHITGGTPSVSRSPSTSNFEAYGANGPSPTIPTNKATSRYAPMGSRPSSSAYDPANSYTPGSRSSMERTSGELRRGSSELPKQGLDMHSVYSNPYAPTPEGSSLTTPSYQPTSAVAPAASSYMPASQGSPPAVLSSGNSFSGYQPYGTAQTSENATSVADVPANGSNVTSGYQPSYSGYEQPSMIPFESSATQLGNSIGGYEPPSYQPSSFEPPSYEPGPADNDDTSPSETMNKKKSFMDDDDDDIPSLRPKEKSKTEKDRENEEMFRKIAEEEAKREAEAKATKKSWGFGSWFGGGKKEAELPNKPIKAKLGEASSFVYDPDLKRWVNKKPGAENTPAKTATPPPPRAAATPPPPGGPTSTPLGAPPPGPPSIRPAPPTGLSKAASQESLLVPGIPPPMARSNSTQSNASAPPGGPISAPPSRPATSLSNASSIDDLLGAAGPRKGTKKPRKSGRYVDVMAK
ncbi:Sec23-binding domain of Sec16-domain-containing protein [Biscogniauxia marginata]|nr:Sec23-binding domain of Sec16-domain-containing protein [Biscogniauxia marginata]